MQKFKSKFAGAYGHMPLDKICRGKPLCLPGFLPGSLRGENGYTPLKIKKHNTGFSSVYFNYFKP
jgi:hypothetical protein